jgi:hypothetical protein
MGKEKQALKERTCELCKQVLVTNAKGIKAHAAACKGVKS